MNTNIFGTRPLMYFKEGLHQSSSISPCSTVPTGTRPSPNMTLTFNYFDGAWSRPSSVQHYLFEHAQHGLPASSTSPPPANVRPRSGSCASQSTQFSDLTCSSLNSFDTALTVPRVDDEEESGSADEFVRDSIALEGEGEHTIQFGPTHPQFPESTPIYQTDWVNGLPFNQRQILSGWMWRKRQPDSGFMLPCRDIDGVWGVPGAKTIPPPNRENLRDGFMTQRDFQFVDPLPDCDTFTDRLATYGDQLIPVGENSYPTHFLTKYPVASCDLEDSGQGLGIAIAGEILTDC